MILTKVGVGVSVSLSQYRLIIMLTFEIFHSEMKTLPTQLCLFYCFRYASFGVKRSDMPTKENMEQHSLIVAGRQQESPKGIYYTCTDRFLVLLFTDLVMNHMMFLVTTTRN